MPSRDIGLREGDPAVANAFIGVDGMHPCTPHIRGVSRSGVVLSSRVLCGDGDWLRDEESRDKGVE